MQFVLVNAFTINMLERAGQDLAFVPVNLDAVRNLVINHSARNEFACAIGHEDTARLVAELIGVPERAEEWAAIARTRPNVTLQRHEISLIVAQYRGPRLPEGATRLPEGAAIEFWQVYHV